jgi:CAAX protease family protein
VTARISSAPSRRAILDGPVSGSRFLRLAVAGEAGLALLAWGLGRWLGISPLENLDLSPSALAWGVAGTIPLLIGLVWILQSDSKPLQRLVALVHQHLGPVLAGCSLTQLALLATLAGIGEELLFRGVVQAGLAQVVPSAAAVIAASLLFGLAHAASATYALLAFVIGAYLGILFLIQGNLVAPIVTHALYDFVALVHVARRWRRG